MATKGSRTYMSLELVPVAGQKSCWRRARWWPLSHWWLVGSFGEFRAGPSPGGCHDSEVSSPAFNDRRVLRTDSLAMTTSQVLTHLYSLDTSSPEFSRHLHRLIKNDEEEGYLSTLQGPELLKLVDFLDGVRSLPHQSISSLRNGFHRLLR